MQVRIYYIKYPDRFDIRAFIGPSPYAIATGTMSYTHESFHGMRRKFSGEEEVEWILESDETITEIGN